MFTTRRRPASRALLATLAALAATTGLLATTTTPASAGQVGVTVGIQGAGKVWVTEGSLEDGAATDCLRLDNQDHRVTVTCPRFRNSEAFEAWVWLRATPAPSPAGHWRFDRWSGCDTFRTRDNATECGVHSGAFSSDERYPVAHFRDVVAPTVTGLTVSQVPSVDRHFQLAFTASDGTTECRVEGLTAWDRCSSGASLAVPEGSHRFQVRATDPSGNTGLAHADAVAVDTRITGGPSSTSRDREPDFSLSTTAGTRFFCSLDHRAYTSCGTGPDANIYYTELADGLHTLIVQARTDSWVDQVPAVWRWTVDTRAPATTLTRSTNGTSATFDFDADEHAYYQCRLDTPGAEGHWLWCQSPQTYTGLAQGEHSFSVKAMDAAGNEETSPPAHRWTVDTMAPATTLVASTTDDRATFAFSAAGATAYECRLTTPTGAGAWQACTSPVSHTGLAAGAHRFEVRATDAAGNVEVAPASHAWVATRPAPSPEPTPGPVTDTTAPETAITSGPSGYVLSPSASFGLGSEAGASYRCELDSRSIPCGTSVTLAGLASGTHRLSVAAVDAAGNVDPTPVVRTWTVPATARDLPITRGWKLRRTTTAYGGSRLESTRRNARLTRKVNGARDVALVVGKGPRHGTVKVYAGSRLLRTVRLAAPRTTARVVVPVASFAAPWTGRLHVVVATQGRPVRIEGLGVATG
jgi:hypothetical protein